MRVQIVSLQRSYDYKLLNLWDILTSSFFMEFQPSPWYRATHVAPTVP